MTTGKIAMGSLAGYAGLGLVMGTLSALLGIGGGAITVPALVLLPFIAFGMNRAIATSLAVIVPIAISGALLQRANVAWGVVPVLAVGGVVGTFIGTGIKREINQDALVKIFGVFMICVGLMMVFNVKGRLAEWAKVHRPEESAGAPADVKDAVEP